jgi:hypothetical protein
MKTYIALLLAACLALLPFNSSHADPVTKTISVIVLVPDPGQPIVLPAAIPPEMRAEVLTALETAPPQFIQGLAAWMVVIVIVVVVGIIIYCLWRCAQMIPSTPPPEPIDPNDNPAFTGARNAGRPLVLVHTSAAPSCRLEGTTDLASWVTLATFTGDQVDYNAAGIPAAAPEKMFFRLVSQ